MKKQIRKPAGTNKLNLSVFRSLCVNLTTTELYEMRAVITSAIRESRRIKKSGINRESNRVNRHNHGAIEDLYSKLMLDDWAVLFSNNDDGRSDYYVYLHIDPRRDGNRVALEYANDSVDIPVPFYVGMGRADRAFNFKRSKMHSAMLLDILGYGYLKDEIVVKFKSNLSRSEAMEIESKLILYFGCKASSYCDKPAMSGHAPVLFNNQYEPYPDKYNGLHMCHSTSRAEAK